MNTALNDKLNLGMAFRYCQEKTYLWTKQMSTSKLTLSFLGKIFCIWHCQIFILVFPENRFSYFMQIVSYNLHEMSKPIFLER